MAEYEWPTAACGCPSTRPHKPSCADGPFYEQHQKRSQGYLWEEDLKRYLCRRGCGGVVWDTEAHSKNVCRVFQPVAGNV